MEKITKFKVFSKCFFVVRFSSIGQGCASLHLAFIWTNSVYMFRSVLVLFVSRLSFVCFCALLCGDNNRDTRKCRKFIAHYLFCVASIHRWFFIIPLKYIITILGRTKGTHSHTHTHTPRKRHTLTHTYIHNGRSMNSLISIIWIVMSSFLLGKLARIFPFYSNNVHRNAIF